MLAELRNGVLVIIPVCGTTDFAMDTWMHKHKEVLNGVPLTVEYSTDRNPAKPPKDKKRRTNHG